jgi:hypothetical protein
VAGDNGNKAELSDLLNSFADELDAHKIIMAHLYEALEPFGISRRASASELKTFGQDEAVQKHLDIFADAMLASLEQSEGSNH